VHQNGQGADSPRLEGRGLIPFEAVGQRLGDGGCGNAPFVFEVRNGSGDPKDAPRRPSRQPKLIHRPAEQAEGVSVGRGV